MWPRFKVAQGWVDGGHALTDRVDRFGQSTNMLNKPSAESSEFATCFDYALFSAANSSRLGWAAFLWPDEKRDYSIKFCTSYIDKFVSQALQNGTAKERPYVFLNEMIDSGAPPQHIRDQLMAMILGGKDTSASTLSALFWTLARRPDIVKKLRDELTALEGRRPTWDDLKNMKYLTMVLKEGKPILYQWSSSISVTLTVAGLVVLRLFPPVATNARSASQDTVLPRGGGPDGQSPLFVPKGTDCRWNSYSLHRRKDIYGDDAEEFRPERWETLRVS